MKLNLFPTLAIIAIGVLASCSNTRTIQVKKLTLDPELTLDRTRVLSQQEIQGIEKAIKNHMAPRRPAIHDISPIHRRDGGGVLAWWLDATIDSESERGIVTNQGAYILDYSEGAWVIRG